MLVALIIARWAEFDPRAAAAHALTIRNDMRWQRDFAIGAAATDRSLLPTEDPSGFGGTGSAMTPKTRARATAARRSG